MIQYRYRFYENLLLDFYRSLPPELFSFPLDMVEIIKLYNDCRLWSYQYYAKVYGLSLDEVIASCHSKSGCTKYDSDQNHYLILFNKEEYPKGRVLFTIAHEFSHIILNHLVLYAESMIAENNMDSDERSFLEKEANTVATMMLAPFPLYNELGVNSSYDIEKVFGLSSEAAGYTYQSYLKWKEKAYKRGTTQDLIALYRQCREQVIKREHM